MRGLTATRAVLPPFTQGDVVFECGLSALSVQEQEVDDLLHVVPEGFCITCV